MDEIRWNAMNSRLNGSMPTFDSLSQSLDGAHSIEASAGTGKTYSITVLWLRLIVEKELSVDEILVSTFTRAATGELSERLLTALRRCITVAHQLEAGINPTDGFEKTIIQRYCAADPDKLKSLILRLANALSSFDLAPISTMHAFSQSLITRHALEIGCDPSLSLAPDCEDILQELLNDTTMILADQPELKLDRLRAVSRAVAKKPSAKLLLGDPKQPSAIVANAIRESLEVRKSAAGVRSFDDILLIVRNALRKGGSDGVLAKAIRKRLRAAIIDECQDSDDVQIEFFKTLFLHTDTVSFIVIGDPKQSIYRFRGADLRSYKDLTTCVVRAPAMTVNHRSDGDLIESINSLYGTPFIFPDSLNLETPTEYIAVSAQAKASRIHDPNSQKALVFLLSQETNREAALADLAKQTAQECLRLLSSGVLIEDRHAPPGTASARPLRPSDIAILASKHVELRLVRREFIAAQIPCQTAGSGMGSVFASDEAHDLLAWLHVFASLEGHGHGSLLNKLIAFLGTPLVGLSPQQLLQLREDPVLQAEYCGKFQADLPKLQRSGPLPLVLRLLSDDQTVNANLSFLEGERRFTNWRQIAGLLQHQHGRGKRSAHILALWLERQIADRPDSTSDDDETSESALLKLDSDADAVQFQTVHASKGLEYPVVFCPFTWNLPSVQNAKSGICQVYRDSDGWVLDIESADHPESAMKAIEQEREEGHRNLYVTLTRARHRVYVGAAAVADGGKSHQNGSHRSPLAHLLAKNNRGTPPENIEQWRAAIECHSLASILDDPQTSTRQPFIGLQPNQSSFPTTPKPIPPHSHLLWRKVSFSSLTKAQHDHDSSQDRSDEAADGERQSIKLGLLEPLGEAGAELGDRLHKVLEEILGNHQSFPKCLPEGESVQKWDSIIQTILNQPLPLPDKSALTLLSIRDRCIAEMQFQLPVEYLASNALSQALLSDPAISCSQKRADWAASIAGWGFPDFEGFLQGFIDLLFEHAGRWYVLDYKTNSLPKYDNSSLEEKMLESHYLLQARLYCAALHRHLKSQLPNYDPNTHFGGVFYLFVRGFPTDGIWFERPSAEALEHLSSLFAQPTSL